MDLCYLFPVHSKCWFLWIHWEGFSSPIEEVYFFSRISVDFFFYLERLLTGKLFLSFKFFEWLPGDFSPVWTLININHHLTQSLLVFRPLFHSITKACKVIKFKSESLFWLVISLYFVGIVISVSLVWVSKNGSSKAVVRQKQGVNGKSKVFTSCWLKAKRKEKRPEFYFLLWEYVLWTNNFTGSTSQFSHDTVVPSYRLIP